MASSFTYPVEENENYPFKDFLLSCARACCSPCREMNGTFVPKEIQAQTQYEEAQIKRVLIEIEEASRLSLSAMQSMFDADYEENCKRASESEKSKSEKLERYRKMKLQVEKWNPPSENHENLKKFMLSQIEESIPYASFDSFWKPERQIATEETKTKRLKELYNELSRYQKQLREQISRADSWNKWLKELWESAEKL